MQSLSTGGVCLFIIFLLLSSVPADASSFTLGLKAWNASFSADNLDGSDDLFFPGFYFSWDINQKLWISAGYIEGEVDFNIVNSTSSGSIEETDSDFIIGWGFSKVDVGIGYRAAEFTTVINDIAFQTESSGPMVYLGGGDLFGQSSWGYYWGVAYMFEDLDDDDGGQEHLNAEGGLRWTSPQNLSVLFGYRYKEYSGDNAAGATFDGLVVNLAYTWQR